MEKPFLIGGLLGKDLLICTLCHEYYKDPRILPCDDTFCRKCLQTVFDEKQAKHSVKLIAMPCPKCSKIVTIPQIGISGFPLDLNIRKKKEEFMNKLIDNVGSTRGNTSKAAGESQQDWTFGRTVYDITSPTDNIDNMDYVRRTRPSFSPGTRRNQMVDGLIRSRRERSPHVSTHTASSATSYFPNIDSFNSEESSHKYKPFSGSRPSRLTQRRRLHEGSRYKSDPGLQTQGLFTTKYKNEDLTDCSQPLQKDSNSNSTSNIASDQVIVDELQDTHFNKNRNTPSSQEKGIGPGESTSTKDHPPLCSIHPERRSRSRRHVRFSHEEKLPECSTKSEKDQESNSASTASVKQSNVTAERTDVTSTVVTPTTKTEDRSFSGLTSPSILKQKKSSLINKNTLDLKSATQISDDKKTNMKEEQTPAKSPVTPTRVRKRPTIPTSLKDKSQEPLSPSSESPGSGKASPDSAKTKDGSPNRKFSFGSFPRSSTKFNSNNEKTRREADRGQNSTSEGTPADSPKYVDTDPSSPRHGQQKSAALKVNTKETSSSNINQVEGQENVQSSPPASLIDRHDKDRNINIKNTKSKYQSDVIDSGVCVSNSHHVDVQPVSPGPKSPLFNSTNVTGDKCTAQSSQAADYHTVTTTAHPASHQHTGKTPLTNHTPGPTAVSSRLQNYKNDVEKKLLDRNNDIVNEPQGYYARYVSANTPYKSKSDPDNIKITSATLSNHKPCSQPEAVVNANQECMVECEEVTLQSSVIQQQHISAPANNVHSAGIESKNTTSRQNLAHQAELSTKTVPEHKKYMVEVEDVTLNTDVILEPGTHETSTLSTQQTNLNGSKITSSESVHTWSGTNPGLGLVHEEIDDKRNDKTSRNDQGHVFKEKLYGFTNIKVSQRIEMPKDFQDTGIKIDRTVTREPRTDKNHTENKPHSTTDINSTNDEKENVTSRVTEQKTHHHDHRDYPNNNNIHLGDHTGANLNCQTDQAKGAGCFNHLKTDHISHHLDQSDKTDPTSPHLDQSDKTDPTRLHLDQSDKTELTSHRLDQSDKTEPVSHHQDQSDKTEPTSHHLDQSDKTGPISHHLDQSDKAEHTSLNLDQSDKANITSEHLDQSDMKSEDLPLNEMSSESELYIARDLWQMEKHDYDMPTSVVVLSNETTVVAEFNTGYLQYFDENGKFMHSVDGIKPFCIATDKADHVIVADRKTKTIRVFDEFGCDVMQWDNDRFKWVSGVACTSDGNYVIYDRDNYKVGIYNQSGDKVFEFGSYGERDTQLCMADFLAVDSKDRIILCDSGNQCIKLFDVNGQFLGKFGSRGHADGQLEWPKGICCDESDNIIVADNRNCRVSMYSPDGVFIQNLVTDFPNPYGVCLSKSQVLGVTHYSLSGFSKLGIFRVEKILQNA